MHYHIYCKEKAIEENHREAIAEFEKDYQLIAKPI